MGTVYYNDKNEGALAPWGLEEAKRLNSPRYQGDTICPVCQDRKMSSPGSKPHRYTANGRCVVCAKVEATDVASVIKGFARMLCRDTLQHHKSPYPVIHYYDDHVQLAAWLDRGKQPDALASTKPCTRKGHPGITDANGKCLLCRDERGTSPRQIAIKSGESWYQPLTPCSMCGGSCKRRVDNGRTGCSVSAAKPRKVTPEQTLMAEKPLMVLPRDTAKAIGLRVYRTGAPCKRGHTGWRYCSTGGCLDCKAAS